MKYQEKLYQIIKEEVSLALSNSTLDNHSEMMEYVYYNLKTMNRIFDMATPALMKQVDSQSIESKVDESDKNQDSYEEHKDNKSAIVDPERPNYPIGCEFTFIKKATGGILDELNYFLPEKILRSFDLQTGNKITILDRKGSYMNGDPIYNFEVTGKRNQETPFLCEVSQGIVSYEDDMFMVSETTGGLLSLEDLYICVVIDEADAKKFDLEAGDIIDGRYYSNNPASTFRVNHKYPLDEVEYLTDERKMLNRNQSEVKTESENSENMIDQMDTEVFKGVKILLIGLRSRINDFQRSSSRTSDIHLTHLSGDERKQRMLAQILRADIVLVSTTENSHDTSKYVASMCNMNSIKIASTDAQGFKSLMADAEKLINSPSPQKSETVANE